MTGKRLTKNNYEDDLFELQATKKNKVQAQYNDYLWKAVKEKEDLEEELGIDLITLFKALQNGIYVKRKNKYTYIDCGDLSLNNKWYSNEYEAMQNDTTIYEGYNLALLGNKEWLYFNDYGKTWALTSEELEDE